MKLSCWNVNGLRAVGRKGFAQWLDQSGADCCLLQETKALPSDLSADLTEVSDYRLRLHPAARRGYSGVGIYYRREPDEWIEGLGVKDFDDEGRALFARYDDLLIGSLYFPNSQAEGKRIDYRLGFGQALIEFCEQKRSEGLRPVLGGDYNVSHQEIDLARPKENVKNPGFLPAEREWMTDFLGRGYLDTWRRQHPDEIGYSWWSYRAGARARNVGWRLDYFCVDEALADRVVSTSIEPETEGSDHCPVWIELSGT